MDFTNQNNRPNQTISSPQPQQSQAPQSPKKVKGKRFSKFREHPLLNLTYLGMLFSITVIIVAVVLAIFFFDTNREEKYVDTTKYQAVFLNGGQVYFGKIKDLNKQYISLEDIYYLQVSQQVQPDETKANNFTLAKLGCELHRPQDSMVINQSQVVFWENLKEDTAQNSVPGAIKAYMASNPSTDCNQQQQKQSSTNSSNSTSNNSGSATTNNSNATNNATDNTSNTNSTNNTTAPTTGN